jgi:WD40 repeat protein/mono/diheme cytochrome c family protein
MTRSRYCFCILCAALAAALALLFFSFNPSPTQAQPAKGPPPKAKGPISFINDVAPILQENCFGCHGAKSPKGKLNMTTFEAFRKGGTKDDPIANGKPEESLLIDVLTTTAKGRMPPADSGDPLSKEKIAVIAQWIKEGAKLDAGIVKEADLLRELRVRWKPPAPHAVYPYPVTVTALAFTPDNKQLVVGGHHELTVWDVNEGKLVKRVRTRARRIMSMVFLPDGKLAVAGGRPGEEGDVRVYNINAPGKQEGGITYLDGVNDTNVMVKQLVGPLDSDDEVLCLAISPDGKKLGAGGCDRLVRVWDISGGVQGAKPIATIENHADWVFGISFAGDGKHLFTCSRDKTAKVWDLVARESVLTFPDHQNTVYGVLAKADGKLGYSAGEDKQLRMFSAAGANLGKQVRNAGGHAGAVLRLIQIPGKPLLATCSADATVRVWNADSLAAVRTLTGHKDHVYAVAASPDGNLLAAGSFDGEVRVWKVADGALVRAFNASPGIKAPEPPKKDVPKKK